MKRSIISLVVLALALAFFGLAQPAPAQAQAFCYDTVQINISAGNLYRVVSETGAIIVRPTLAQNSPVNINISYLGTVKVQTGPNQNPTTWSDVAVYTCNCSKLIGSYTNRGNDSNFRLTIFADGNPVKTETKALPPQPNSNDRTISVEIDAPPDSNATYTYVVIDLGPNLQQSNVVAQGTLTRSCGSFLPCGVGSGPLGQMTRTVPLYTTPGGAPSTFVAEAGKTFKTHGTQSGFTRISLACQFFWVPSDAIALCADPLCR